MLAIPPETKGAPIAKNNGGRTAPKRETPAAVVSKFASKGKTDGMSRMNKIRIMIVDPVAISEVRVNGSTFTATFPLKKINPAYVKAERIPNRRPLKGSPCISPFTKFEAKKTPIKIRMIDNTVIGEGFTLLNIHSKMMPIHTNWNINMMASDAGKYCMEP